MVALRLGAVPTRHSKVAEDVVREHHEIRKNTGAHVPRRVHEHKPIAVRVQGKYRSCSCRRIDNPVFQDSEALVERELPAQVGNAVLGELTSTTRIGGSSTMPSRLNRATARCAITMRSGCTTSCRETNTLIGDSKTRKLPSSTRFAARRS